MTNFEYFKKQIKMFNYQIAVNERGCVFLCEDGYSCPNCIWNGTVCKDEFTKWLYSEHIEKRVEQLSIDVIIPNGMAIDEVINKVTKEFERLGVEVVGFMPTDTSWTFEEYGLYERI